MKKSIFRKTSLERLSSPEQLDQLVRVTNPIGWVALLAILFLLVVAIVWGFLGSLPTKVMGQGILISPGGVKEIVAGVSGQVTDVYFDVGDRVQQDQVVARILQPGQTVGTPVVSPHNGRVLEIQVDEGALANPATAILTVGIETGDGSGHEAAHHHDLQLIIYVSPTAGKQLYPGMAAQISPATVQREEYGLILGRVLSVGEFPATSAGMLRTLGNEKLVQTLASGGNSIEVRIDLFPDENTPSGFQWTSPQGPPVEIQNGTPATAWITVETQSPISLILPVLGK